MTPRKRTLPGMAFCCAIFLFISGCGRTPDPAGSTRYNAKADSLSYEARLGRVLWFRYCVVCHGPEGRGDGFNAFNLNPHPRDIADSVFQQSLDDNRLKEIIRLGGALRGGSPRMPAWGGTLNDQDIGRLVEFVRVLGHSRK